MTVHLVEVRYAHGALEKGTKFDFDTEDDPNGNIQTMIDAGYWAIVDTEPDSAQVDDLVLDDASEPGLPVKRTKKA